MGTDNPDPQIFPVLPILLRIVLMVLATAHPSIYLYLILDRRCQLSADTINKVWNRKRDSERWQAPSSSPEL
jgi:hypothetical protein